MNMSHFWSTCFLKTSLNSDLSNCSQQKKKNFSTGRRVFFTDEREPAKVGPLQKEELELCCVREWKTMQHEDEALLREAWPWRAKKRSFFSSIIIFSSELSAAAAEVCVCVLERAPNRTADAIFLCLWISLENQIHAGGKWRILALKKLSHFLFQMVPAAIATKAPII